MNLSLLGSPVVPLIRFVAFAGGTNQSKRWHEVQRIERALRKAAPATRLRAANRQLSLACSLLALPMPRLAQWTRPSRKLLKQSGASTAGARMRRQSEVPRSLLCECLWDSRTGACVCARVCVPRGRGSAAPGKRSMCLLYYCYC